MIKCPKCHVELDWDDVIDTELRDTNEMANTCQGTCPMCGGLFVWTDVYKFDRVENLQQIIKDSAYY